MPENEHDRYARFAEKLKRAKLADLKLVEEFIASALMEPDSVARGAMLVLIATDRTLEISLLTLLKNHEAFADDFLQKIIAREHLLRAIEDGNLTEDLFNKCVAHPHDGIHRKLLSFSNLTYEQLRILCDKGVNTAVRNLARERIKNRFSARSPNENNPEPLKDRALLRPPPDKRTR